MVPSEALQRTFHFKYGDQSGTCCAIDVGSEQYVVTAAHIITGNKLNNPCPQIMHEKTWKDVPCTLIGCAPNNIDIAVFALSSRIAGDLKLTPESKGIFLSQDVYFLGFPYGLRCDVGAVNSDFPIPLIRKGCLSKIATSDDNRLIIDGHNNVGFSGGPVIFSRGKETCVAGIISGHIWMQEEFAVQGHSAPVKIWAEAGLVLAYEIDHATKLIHDSCSKR